MSQINIFYKGPLHGEVIPPPDKSISHRAIILSSVAEGRSILKNVLRAEDPLRTLNAFRMMGISIRESEDSPDNTIDLAINGKGLYGLKAPNKPIDCGNSGTSMRLLSGILSAQPFVSELTGDDSLRSRPMKRIIKPLSGMGASIDSREGGLPPLRIRGGKLNAINYNSPVASAQVKSAILLAGLYCNGVTSVSEPGKSRDHTERMLSACGAEIIERGLKVSVRGIARLKPMELVVPGDLSSAAFFIVAGIIIQGSEIIIRNVGINPTRTGVIEILRDMGGDIRLDNQRILSGEPIADIIVKHSRLKGADIKGDRVLKAIDEFPVLCVAASLAEGTTEITGAKELRVKESDRIATMSNELQKMGVRIKELDDGLIIEGSNRLRASTVHSHGDHRVAMSLAIAALSAEGETKIMDTECINTSFPGFFNLLKGLQQ